MLFTAPPKQEGMHPIHC